MMCRLLLGRVALALLLPALVTASERKYPPEMPVSNGKPLSFIKDRDGNVVDGSWEHLEKARERCRDKGSIVVEVVLFHEGYEQNEREGNLSRRVAGRRALESEFEALLGDFVASIEAMGFEAEVGFRSTLVPVLFLRVDRNVLDVLTTHLMVARITDSGQIKGEWFSEATTPPPY